MSNNLFSQSRHYEDTSEFPFNQRLSFPLQFKQNVICHGILIDFSKTNTVPEMLINEIPVISSNDRYVTWKLVMYDRQRIPIS